MNEYEYDDEDRAHIAQLVELMKDNDFAREAIAKFVVTHELIHDEVEETGIAGNTTDFGDLMYNLFGVLCVFLTPVALLFFLYGWAHLFANN